VKMAVLREASVLPWALRLGEDFATGWVSARAHAKSQEKPRGRGAKANKSQRGRASESQEKPTAQREKPRKANESQARAIRVAAGGGRALRRTA